MSIYMKIRKMSWLESAETGYDLQHWEIMIKNNSLAVSFG